MNIVAPQTSEGRIEWFGGDAHGLQMYRLLVDLLHTWDDLVDGDRVVTEYQVNNAFLICLFQLQLNPVYRKIQDSILPMWVTVVAAYEAANQLERDGEAHGLEISHTLRYAAGNIVAFAMVACSGTENARRFMPEMWRAVVAERFTPYLQEHQK